jgi:hypothetical protein
VATGFACALELFLPFGDGDGDGVASGTLKRNRQL